MNDLELQARPDQMNDIKTPNPKEVFLEMFPDTDIVWLDKEIKAGRIYLKSLA